jgi:hypothetical protein
MEVLNIRIIPDLNKFDCILDSGHRIWSSILTLNKLMLPSWEIYCTSSP